MTATVKLPHSKRVSGPLCGRSKIQSSAFFFRQNYTSEFWATQLQVTLPWWSQAEYFATNFEVTCWKWKKNLWMASRHICTWILGKATPSYIPWTTSSRIFCHTLQSDTLEVERNLRITIKHFCTAKWFLNNIFPLLRALGSIHDAHATVRDICRLLQYVWVVDPVQVMAPAGCQIRAGGSCLHTTGWLLCSLGRYYRIGSTPCTIKSKIFHNQCPTVQVVQVHINRLYAKVLLMSRGKLAKPSCLQVYRCYQLWPTKNIGDYFAGLIYQVTWWKCVPLANRRQPSCRITIMSYASLSMWKTPTHKLKIRVTLHYCCIVVSQPSTFFKRQGQPFLCLYREEMTL